MSVRLNSLDVGAWFEWAPVEFDATEFYPGPCRVVEHVHIDGRDYTRHTWSGTGVRQHDSNRRVVIVPAPLVELAKEAEHG